MKILATGIGSMPQEDADQALDLIFKYTPHVPFWPQLPKRDKREGMVAQYSQGLPCLKVTADGLFFDPKDKDKQLELLYERIIANDLEHFKISPDFAPGLYKFCQRLEKQDLKGVEYIKGQMTGPFTFAASAKDESGKALLHDKVFMQTILKGLAMKALWQVRLLKKFKKKVILFLDEPYLGAFGSAYTAINREDVVKGLSEVLSAVKSEGVLLGAHCCGNTDWSIFTDIDALDMISFDAFGFLDKFSLYADDLKGFLARGGGICWGIVPTQEFSEKTTLKLLKEKFKAATEALAAKGLQRELLFKNSLISPSCGMGTLDADRSAKILTLLSEAENKLFDI
ncbi:methionine synthase [Candidatus Omnitrophota bacterium]